MDSIHHPRIIEAIGSDTEVETKTIGAFCPSSVGEDGKTFIGKRLLICKCAMDFNKIDMEMNESSSQAN
jgi:hypothetical protein